jgi:hypothetical protein
VKDLRAAAATVQQKKAAALANCGQRLSKKLCTMDLKLQEALSDKVAVLEATTTNSLLMLAYGTHAILHARACDGLPICTQVSCDAERLSLC